MIQDTIWFWVLLSLAGLLSFMVAFIMVFMNNDTNRFYRFRGYFMALFMGFVLWLSSYLLPVSPTTGLLQVFAFAYSIPILFLCLYLFLHPGILYGAAFSGSQVSANTTEIQQAFQKEIKPIKQIKEIEEKKEIENDKEKVTSPALRTSLTIEQSLKYQQIIKNHFAETLAFRKPGYAIRDLSNETGIPGYLVSLFINQEYGMNFNEFVNAYRVEYLAGLLKTSFNCESYTLEAIGKMAGFNSRTAFIAAIKRYTGMTPSAFFGRRESVNIEYTISNFPERMRDVA